MGIQDTNVRYYFDTPIVIDAAHRAKLDAFKKADAEARVGMVRKYEDPL